MRRLSGDEGKEVTYSRGTAEGDIILDDTGKKNGRGAYICKSLECFKKAKKTKALERSLGVSVSEQVYEELEKEMNQIDR